MKTIGIICEYNPFHLGHSYQLEQIRQQHRHTDHTIVCLMSGHAVQRGELAVVDKMTRASMALACGVDVVLELPYPYCAASAAYFAGAGVAILDALGVDELCFGSECADLSLLTRAATAMASEEVLSQVRMRQRCGEGSAQAYFGVLRQRLDIPALPFLANDILALEYLRALRVLDSRMQPVPIQRIGSNYLDPVWQAEQCPSATALREELARGNDVKALSAIPENSRIYLKHALTENRAPVQMARLEAAILSFFRLRNPASLEEIAEMQGGLANRLCTAALESSTGREMLSRASAKSYPTARLRRAILFAMTGVTGLDLQTPPAYLFLLGASERGRCLLRRWKKESPIPVIAKFADAASLSLTATRQSELSQALDALFTLALPKPCAADELMKQPPVIYRE